jgi:hypothetical protein
MAKRPKGQNLKHQTKLPLGIKNGQQVYFTCLIQTFMKTQKFNTWFFFHIFCSNQANQNLFFIYFQKSMQ